MDDIVSIKNEIRRLEEKWNADMRGQYTAGGNSKDNEKLIKLKNAIKIIERVKNVG